MKRKTWWRIAAVAVLVSVTCVAVAAAGIAGAGSAPVTIDTRKPTAPAIAGDRVVWSDYVDDSYEIFLYDGASGVTSRLTSTPENEVQPATDGKTVVWAQYGAKDADIIAYDIASRSYVTVTNASGNQLNPDVNGGFVVWEERGRSYVPQVYARSLSGGDPFKIDGLSQSAARRPRMGGDWVVYEYLPMNLSDDGDIRAYNFVTKAITTIANTDAQEILPVTDGRYVIWADGSGADRDIQGYDLLAGSAFPVRVQAGNQTYPVIDGGVAYWVHNQPGKRLHLDGYDIAGAQAFAFNDAGSSDVNAVSARGGGIAWLEPRADGQWRLRAILGPTAGATSSLASLLPVSPAWLPFRLAQLSTAGDTTAPAIVSTSVKPGATNVDANTDVTVYFSEALDASTVDAESMQLVAASMGEPVDAAVRYSARAKAVTVSPDEPLAEDSYTLSVAAGVSDRVGNAIGTPLAVSFATDSIMADTLAPTKPGNPTARVSGLTQVALTWTASVDDVGVTGYDIYRDTVSFITIGSRTPIASVGAGATSALVNIDSTVPSERTKKYTLYYVIVAKDAAGNTALSGNAVPDPHGTTAIGTNTCLGCHSVHGGGSRPSSWGALGAKGAEACYLCHGNTAAATAFGYGSSLNTQARFFDYVASPLPSGGTRHRNTYMAVTSGNQNSCDMCHTSHRKPYDTDSTKGYTRMVRYWDTGSGGRFLYYRSDGNVVDVNGVVVQAGLGKEYCASCHGASLERIENIDVGGPGAWASSSGDHLTGFDAGAHGSATVRWDPARPTADGPKISCEACHNKHASPIGGLVDYRVSNTQTSEYEQSGVCFACHVDNYVAEQESGMSVSTNAFSAWNGRNVRTEFARVSSHPYSAQTGSLTCYNCHNTHMVQKGTAGAAWQTSRVSNPANTKQNYSGTGFASFCLACHKQSSGTVLSAVTNSSTTLVPYRVVLRDMGAYSFFPGWNKTTTSVDWAGSRHAAVGAVPGCETCHDPHGSNFPRLTALTQGANVRANTNAAVSKEQNLCSSSDGCHSSTAAGSKNTGTAFAQTYKHPIATDDVHTDLEDQSNFGSEKRHSECVDCHDPHAARAGIHTAGSATAGGAVRGSFGVKPSWSGEWTVATGYTIVRNTGQATDYEAYLCFKCHSSYSGQPYSVTSNGRTYTSTDVALEFNENNESGHNVIGKSTDGSSIWPKTSGVGAADNRTWSLPTTANWLKTGWTPTSKVTCSDCHTWGGTGAAGPHGSSVKYMLDSGFPTDCETAYLDMSQASRDALICSKCHNSNYRGMNNVHARGDHAGVVDARCIGCHVKIPHGWKRPRLLGYRSDPEPYRALYLTGITDKNYTATGWNKSDCGQSGCGGHSANPAGTRWP
ncbi:MAG: cytochrome c3 family protein [Actinomycetota bacterium]|nr:cytochrome c3 family protein [Actinomycetota bacterium]